MDLVVLLSFFEYCKLVIELFMDRYTILLS